MLFWKSDEVEGPQAGPLSMNPTRSLPAATLSLTMLLPKARLKVAGFCRVEKQEINSLSVYVTGCCSSGMKSHLIFDNCIRDRDRFHACLYLNELTNKFCLLTSAISLMVPRAKFPLMTLPGVWTSTV